MDNATQRSNTTKVKQFAKNNKKLLAVLLVILLLVLAAYAIHKRAYDRGYTAGKKAGQAAANPVDNFFRNQSSPFSTISGEVKTVSADEITLETNAKETKKIKITDKTKITQKTTTLKTSDIKVGQKISVFTTGKDKDTATRIVVRAQQ